MPSWLSTLLATKFLVLYVFVASGLYIHFRGRERHVLSRLVDQTTFLGPYNVLMYLFSAVPRTPTLAREHFPQLSVLRENWEMIRDEALALQDEAGIRQETDVHDVAFASFLRQGWTRYYLKWYEDPLPSAQEQCPRTVELLNSIPSVRAAMFAAMKPQSYLARHRDPFAGSLRYHLGLKTPNSDLCRIYIDGEPYAWRDGDDIIFDETYIHEVNNDTDDHRLILFCDVERPLRSRMLAAVNRFVGKWLGKATAAQNAPTEKVGLVNKAFGLHDRLRSVLKRLKQKNRPLFKVAQLTLVGALVYWIFF